MSGSTEQLGKKISGARDLGGVVRAMKALAASSVGQYERAVEALDDYLRTVELGLIACLHGDGQGLRTGAAKPQHAPQIGAVIFGSDQGLVGSFNEVIVEFSLQALRALPSKVNRIWVVGERAKVRFEDLKYQGLSMRSHHSSGRSYSNFRRLGKRARFGRFMSFTITQNPAQRTSPLAGVCFPWTPHGRKNFVPRHGRQRRLLR